MRKLDKKLIPYGLTPGQLEMSVVHSTYNSGNSNEQKIHVKHTIIADEIKKKTQPLLLIEEKSG